MNSILIHLLSHFYSLCICSSIFHFLFIHILFPQSLSGLSHTRALSLSLSLSLSHSRLAGTRALICHFTLKNIDLTYNTISGIKLKTSLWDSERRWRWWLSLLWRGQQVLLFLWRFYNFICNSVKIVYEFVITLMTCEMWNVNGEKKRKEKKK